MLRFALSLISKDNDYQQAQAVAAKETAARLGVGLDILYCEGDSIEQSQHLLKIIQSPSQGSRINGILVQPAGTGLRQVAEAAAAAGIGWVVLHREVEYAAEFSQKHRVPVFMVTSDHAEEGRIQAQQLAILMPKGGTVLYITGPKTDAIVQGRSEGLNKAKRPDVQLLTVSGKWTEQSGADAISSWLKLSTSRQQTISAIVSQNDAMASGARSALTQLPAGEWKDALLSIPVIGCDGLPGSGQAWVRRGFLKATIVVPPLAGTALELLVKAMKSGQRVEEHTIVSPQPYPALAELG